MGLGELNDMINFCGIDVPKKKKEEPRKATPFHEQCTNCPDMERCKEEVEKKGDSAICVRWWCCGVKVEYVATGNIKEDRYECSVCHKTISIMTSEREG